MIADLPPDLTARHLAEGDHPRVLAALYRAFFTLAGSRGRRVAFTLDLRR